MLTKKEIGQNLRKFAEDNFKTLTEAARALDMSLQSFRTYYEGKSIPGGEIIAKLANLGCDIEWLLNGKTINIINENQNKYNILSEVEALSKEISDMKEVIKELKEMNGELNYKLRKLEREKEELEKENEQIRDQSARIAALSAKGDHGKNKQLKK